MRDWFEFSSDAATLEPEAFAGKHGPAFLVSWDSAGQMQAGMGETQPLGVSPADSEKIRESMRSTVEDLSQEAGQMIIYPLVPKGDGREVSIGRAEASGVCLAESSVSLEHAVFRMDASGGFLLVDRASQNGSKIDGQDIESNRAYDVPSGKTVQFGNVRLTFMIAWQFQEFVRAAGGLLRR